MTEALEMPMEPEDDRRNILVKVGGQPFRCECGCNVFHGPPDDLDLFECNACDRAYRSD